MAAIEYECRTGDPAAGCCQEVDGGVGDVFGSSDAQWILGLGFLQATRRTERGFIHGGSYQAWCKAIDADVPLRAFQGQRLAWGRGVMKSRQRADQPIGISGPMPMPSAKS